MMHYGMMGILAGDAEMSIGPLWIDCYGNDGCKHCVTGQRSSQQGATSRCSPHGRSLRILSKRELKELVLYSPDIARPDKVGQSPKPVQLGADRRVWFCQAPPSAPPNPAYREVLGCMNSRDSHFLGGGFGGAGSFGVERHRLGTDVGSDHRPARPEGLDRARQPDVCRGGAVDRAHRLALA